MVKLQLHGCEVTILLTKLPLEHGKVATHPNPLQGATTVRYRLSMVKLQRALFLNPFWTGWQLPLEHGKVATRATRSLKNQVPSLPLEHGKVATPPECIFACAMNMCYRLSMVKLQR